MYIPPAPPPDLPQPQANRRTTKKHKICASDFASTYPRPRPRNTWSAFPRSPFHHAFGLSIAPRHVTRTYIMWRVTSRDVTRKYFRGGCRVRGYVVFRGSRWSVTHLCIGAIITKSDRVRIAATLSSRITRLFHRACHAYSVYCTWTL